RRQRHRPGRTKTSHGANENAGGNGIAHKAPCVESNEKIKQSHRISRGYGMAQVCNFSRTVKHPHRPPMVLPTIEEFHRMHRLSFSCLATAVLCGAATLAQAADLAHYDAATDQLRL